MLLYGVFLKWYTCKVYTYTAGILYVVFPRKLSIRPRRFERPVTICLNHESILPCLCIACCCILLYENMKWGWRRPKQNVWREHRYWVLSLASLFPIYYSFDALFLYTNDRWYPLLPMQVVFTSVEVACLYARWFNKWTSCRFNLRLSVLLFNLIVEQDKMCVRNLLLLVCGIFPLYDMLKMGHRPRLYRLLYVILALGLVVANVPY